MKKIIPVLFLAYLAMIGSASAYTHDQHALGDMYTKALNMVEAEGNLDTLGSARYLSISDMHMDHGQISVSVIAVNAPPAIFVYDPIAGRIIDRR